MSLDNLKNLIGQGKISWQQLDEQLKKNNASAEQRKAAQSIFTTINTDGDKNISSKEMGLFVEKHSQIDTDGDGHISKEEIDNATDDNYLKSFGNNVNDFIKLVQQALSPKKMSLSVKESIILAGGEIKDDKMGLISDEDKQLLGHQSIQKSLEGEVTNQQGFSFGSGGVEFQVNHNTQTKDDANDKRVINNSYAVGYNPEEGSGNATWNKEVVNTNMTSSTTRTHSAEVTTEGKVTYNYKKEKGSGEPSEDGEEMSPTNPYSTTIGLEVNVDGDFTAEYSKDGQTTIGKVFERADLTTGNMMTFNVMGFQKEGQGYNVAINAKYQYKKTNVFHALSKNVGGITLNIPEYTTSNIWDLGLNVDAFGNFELQYDKNWQNKTQDRGSFTASAAYSVDMGKFSNSLTFNKKGTSNVTNKISVDIAEKGNDFGLQYRYDYTPSNGAGNKSLNVGVHYTHGANENENSPFIPIDPNIFAGLSTTKSVELDDSGDSGGLTDWKLSSVYRFDPYALSLESTNLKDVRFGANWRLGETTGTSNMLSLYTEYNDGEKGVNIGTGWGHTGYGDDKKFDYHFATTMEVNTHSGDWNVASGIVKPIRYHGAQNGTWGTTFNYNSENNASTLGMTIKQTFYESPNETIKRMPVPELNIQLETVTGENGVTYYAPVYQVDEVQKDDEVKGDVNTAEPTEKEQDAKSSNATVKTISFEEYANLYFQKYPYKFNQPNELSIVKAEYSLEILNFKLDSSDYKPISSSGISVVKSPDNPAQKGKGPNIPSLGKPNATGMMNGIVPNPTGGSGMQNTAGMMNGGASVPSIVGLSGSGGSFTGMGGIAGVGNSGSDVGELQFENRAQVSNAINNGVKPILKDQRLLAGYYFDTKLEHSDLNNQWLNYKIDFQYFKNFYRKGQPITLAGRVMNTNGAITAGNNVFGSQLINPTLNNDVARVAFGAESYGKYQNVSFAQDYFATAEDVTVAGIALISGNPQNVGSSYAIGGNVIFANGKPEQYTIMGQYQNVMTNHPGTSRITSGVTVLYKSSDGGENKNFTGEYSYDYTFNKHKTKVKADIGFSGNSISGAKSITAYAGIGFSHPVWKNLTVYGNLEAGQRISLDNISNDDDPTYLAFQRGIEYPLNNSTSISLGYNSGNGVSLDMTKVNQSGINWGNWAIGIRKSF